MKVCITKIDPKSREKEIKHRDEVMESNDCPRNFLKKIRHMGSPQHHQNPYQLLCPRTLWHWSLKKHIFHAISPHIFIFMLITMNEERYPLNVRYTFFQHTYIWKRYELTWAAYVRWNMFFSELSWDQNYNRNPQRLFQWSEISSQITTEDQSSKTNFQQWTNI